MRRCGMDTAWLGRATSTFLLFARTSGCDAMGDSLYRFALRRSQPMILKNPDSTETAGHGWWVIRPSAVFAGVR
jgi:hypothetical protein